MVDFAEYSRRNTVLMNFSRLRKEHYEKQRELQKRKEKLLQEQQEKAKQDKING